jgi:hypothetical protein
MNDSILLDKRDPARSNVIQAFLLALLIGIVGGWGAAAWVMSNRVQTTTTKTILVPSNDYAKPYDVCQGGFPFIITKVIEQGKTDDDRTTWVAGHPLNQKQVIVCAKAGSYSDIWKPGMMIALYSASAT